MGVRLFPLAEVLGCGRKGTVPLKRLFRGREKDSQPNPVVH